MTFNKGELNEKNIIASSHHRIIASSHIIIIMPTHKSSHYKTYKQFNSFIYFSKQAFLVP